MLVISPSASLDVTEGQGRKRVFKLRFALSALFRHCFRMRSMPGSTYGLPSFCEATVRVRCLPVRESSAAGVSGVATAGRKGYCIEPLFPEYDFQHSRFQFGIPLWANHRRDQCEVCCMPACGHLLRHERNFRQPSAAPISAVARKPVTPPPPSGTTGHSGKHSTGLESVLPFFATPFLLGGCCQVAEI
jgi:hypothetical protein